MHDSSGSYALYVVGPLRFAGRRSSFAFCLPFVHYIRWEAVGVNSMFNTDAVPVFKPILSR